VVNGPGYLVRVSSRARHVRLKVTPAEGLCVVVPWGFDPADVPALVAEKRAWIDKALLRIGGAPTPIGADFLPDHLALTAFDERWQLAYRPGGQRGRLSEDPLNSRLIMSAAVHDQAVVFSQLRRWLSKRARTMLEPQVRSMAAELGFEINRLSIRNQRTRWGSCTSKKNLSLNLKLLFVTPRQLRYVLVHELCHTVEMNHSPAFWALVERFEPESRVLRKSMHSAWQAVPPWI